MERFRVFEPDQHVLLVLNPTESFGKDSFEHFLVSTFKSLDLSPFWSNLDHGGEAPYHPCSMLGIILYGFCRGIFSSRKLEHGCKHDIGFMYVSGHNTQDHVAICRFLNRFSKELKQIFSQVIYIFHNKGFVDYHHLALDGTKIRANASRNYTGTLQDFRKRIASIDRYVEKAISRLSSPDGENVAQLKNRLIRRRLRKTA
jgi:transposase